jgi:hypothetical protein
MSAPISFSQTVRAVPRALITCCCLKLQNLTNHILHTRSLLTIIMREYRSCGLWYRCQYSHWMRLDDRGSILCREGTISSSPRPGTNWNPFSYVFIYFTEPVPRCKTAWGWSDHPPWFHANLRMSGAIPELPPHILVMHRERTGTIFIFSFTEPSGYGLDDLGVRVRVPVGSRIFS